MTVTARKVADAFGVSAMLVTKWAQAGCPRERGTTTTGRGGRPAWRYDLDQVGEWLMSRGKASAEEVEAAKRKAGAVRQPVNKSRRRSAKKRKSAKADSSDDLDVAPSEDDDLRTSKLKAQVAKLRAEIKHRELLNAEKERTHVRLESIRELVMGAAEDFRKAGELIERDFGQQAKAIIDAACDKVDRRVKAMRA